MWHFTKRGQQETIQESKLDQFFNGLGDAESLIRESIQNALDAKADNSDPVNMRFVLGEKNRSDFPEIFSETDERIQLIRTQTKRNYPEIVPDVYPYVLIEDFNTTGFTGTIDKNNKDQSASFCGFWWEEGKSTKRKGGGGSHGVGKVTLSESSKSRMFFSYSKRIEDGDELLFGYCRMGGHRMNSFEYRDYARYGKEEKSNDSEPPLFPYSAKKGDKVVIEKFKSQFLSRSMESGVSILIPNIDKGEINREKICQSIIRNFYLPIFKGILQISVVSENEDIKFDKESLKEKVVFFCGGDSEVVRLIELVEYSDGKIGYTPSTDFDIDKDNHTDVKLMFSEEAFLGMKNDFESGSVVVTTFAVPLFPFGQDKEIGNFRLIIRNKDSADKEHKVKKVYDVFRGDVRIKDESIGSRHKYTEVILDVFGAHDQEEPNPLSEFLKYCEDPGHTNWRGSINRRNEPLKYKRDEVWQKEFVQDIAKNMLNLLEGIEQEDIKDFADDVFSLPKPIVGHVDSDDEVLEGEGDTKTVIGPGPIEANPSLFTIQKINSGFKVVGTKHLKDALPIDGTLIFAKIVACYEIFGASKQKWLKCHSGFDFDFNKSDTLTIKTDGVNLIKKSENQIIFSIAALDFFIEIIGFDSNRDLYVNVKEMEAEK